MTRGKINNTIKWRARYPISHLCSHFQRELNCGVCTAGVTAESGLVLAFFSLFSLSSLQLPFLVHAIKVHVFTSAFENSLSQKTLNEMSKRKHRNKKTTNIKNNPVPQGEFLMPDVPDETQDETTNHRQNPNNAERQISQPKGLLSRGWAFVRDPKHSGL